MSDSKLSNMVRLPASEWTTNNALALFHAESAPAACSDDAIARRERIQGLLSLCLPYASHLPFLPSDRGDSRAQEKILDTLSGTVADWLDRIEEIASTETTVEQCRRHSGQFREKLLEWAGGTTAYPAVRESGLDTSAGNDLLILPKSRARAEEAESHRSTSSVSSLRSTELSRTRAGLIAEIEALPVEFCTKLGGDSKDAAIRNVLIYPGLSDTGVEGGSGEGQSNDVAVRVVEQPGESLHYGAHLPADGDDQGKADRLRGPFRRVANLNAARLRKTDELAEAEPGIRPRLGRNIVLGTHVHRASSHLTIEVRFPRFKWDANEKTETHDDAGSSVDKPQGQQANHERRRVELAAWNRYLNRLCSRVATYVPARMAVHFALYPPFDSDRLVSAEGTPSFPLGFGLRLGSREMATQSDSPALVDSAPKPEPNIEPQPMKQEAVADLLAELRKLRLTRIGIGEATAEKLVDSGVTNLKKLADSDPGTLGAQLADLTPNENEKTRLRNSVERWIDKANEAIK